MRQIKIDNGEEIMPESVKVDGKNSISENTPNNKKKHDSSEKPKSSRKPILASKAMKGIMADYFHEIDEASNNPNELVAWCTSVGPAELLLSFGFKVYYPENHGAMLGATRKAMELIPVANALGYSPDICSYLTSDIGSFLKHDSPMFSAYDMKEFPKPDVLAYNTNQCRDVQEWLSYYSRKFNVPIIGINAPDKVDELQEAHIKAAHGQFESLVEPLEKISGNSYNEGKLKEIVNLSRTCTDLWKQVLETAAHKPSPFTFFDGTIHMGPAVVLRGSQIAVDYYKLLLNELNERIENNVAAVDDEQFRLYWEGMPIWGKLRDLSSQFQEHGTCVVASTYCNSWIFDGFDPERPLYGMAKAYTEIFINRSERIKEQYIDNMIKKYDIDGIIFHDSKTCPSNSNARYGMPERLKEKGIPTLVLDGDLNDLRCYSEEQSKTKIEAFIEQLKGS
jgi:benzoyl-CoA reductase/2-hydroxyglutaryl-CoA dehydratase subunit BcrC/BadD/HgdB